MKPFNLKEAMVGKGICTRDGTVMKFGAYIPDARKNTRLIVMELSGQLTCRHDDGRFYQEQDSQLDLFMAPNTKSQEVYLYKTGHGIPGCDQAPEPQH